MCLADVSDVVRDGRDFGESLQKVSECLLRSWEFIFALVGITNFELASRI